MRITPHGWWTLGAALALALGAWATGANTLYGLLALILSAWAVQLTVGPLSLAGLSLSRALPEEVYAGREAQGSFALVAGRLAVGRVEVVELDGAEGEARLRALGPGERRTQGTAWRWGRRGRGVLGKVALRSQGPLGLCVHQRVVDQAAEVVVYPAPLRGSPGGGTGEGEGTSPHGRGLGDLEGLRPYREGDPVSRIHWPATARTGRPWVGMRGEERGEQAWVVVEALEGEAWERALSEAAGALLDAAELGQAVGLILGDERLPPQRGEAWLRHLLTALASAPRR
ncbi:MAG: DUF58 domain-containing protein [Deltaproteobacteria bacterium]|nr:DUF58 domain-containing protein [Deltaproteobacteria bacterium]